MFSESLSWLELAWQFIAMTRNNLMYYFKFLRLGIYFQVQTIGCTTPFGLYTRGHSTTTWSKFYTILTPTPKVDKKKNTLHTICLLSRDPFGYSIPPPPSSSRSYWTTTKDKDNICRNQTKALIAKAFPSFSLSESVVHKSQLQ